MSEQLTPSTLNAARRRVRSFAGFRVSFQRVWTVYPDVGDVVDEVRVEVRAEFEFKFVDAIHAYFER